MLDVYVDMPQQTPPECQVSAPKMVMVMIVTENNKRT